MTRKRILVVAMLDSVHTYRWLLQFSAKEIDFVICSSKKFRNLHPELKVLLNTSGVASYRLGKFNYFKGISGYLDYFFYILLSKYFGLNLRVRSIRRISRTGEFNFVHALEIQGAGYVACGALAAVNPRPKLIVTNWGSDIYYFQNIPEHKSRIIETLAAADYYSAECQRDYELAKSLGFNGISLPCIPNAGGFDLSIMETQVSTSSRKTIVAKAYGGVFGRGDLIIMALSNVLKSNLEFNVFLYSVTDDLVDSVESLSALFPGRVGFSTRKNHLSRDEMKSLFMNSRIYVGASVSDGISTSFLESLVYGAYPIQTNTSCAGDWVGFGASASVVNLDSSEIECAITRALSDDEFVDAAQAANIQIARQYLDKEVISTVAHSFYNC
jgi:hypothetical protein